MADNLLADIGAALSAISVAFNAVGTSYFVGGSFASSIQGEYRATNDLDIICNLLPKQTSEFIVALDRAFIVDDVALTSAVVSGNTCNIIHEESFIKIDLFFARDEIRALHLERAITVTLPDSGLAIRVASPEDIILAKLSWFRKGGEISERQWRDVAGVLRVQGDRLDMQYLHALASRMLVQDLLARALKEREQT